MSPEDRQKLCKALRRLCDGGEWWPTIYEDAADEIERLASELKREESESEHYVRLAFIDAGANPAVTWKREAERLAEELRITNKALSMYSDECNKVYESFDKKLDEIEAALAQSDAEPHEELVTLEPREFVTKVTMDEVTMPNVAQSHAAAHVQHLRKRIRELEAEKRASYTTPPRPAQSDAEPPMFQCPECGGEIPHKFACNAEPVAIHDAREQALSEIFVKGFEDGRAHELSAIAAAIGSNRFMDSPDGGDVSLAEQVRRMREALEKAEARPDTSETDQLKPVPEVKVALDANAEWARFFYDWAQDIRTRAADRSGK